VVIESGVKGGSLITADIANSYDREVMAFPGRPTDAKSIGCNRLIKDNKAHLITGAEDLLKLMEWLPDPKKKKAPVQNVLFVDLMPEEQALVDVLKEKGKLGIDDLCLLSKIPQHKAAGILLNMEFNGVLRSLPGKVYQLNGSL
jgi:DNA processing protein